MKKVFLLSACLLLALPATAQWGKKIKGNGKMVTEQRSVGSYDGVALSGWFDIELVSGQEGELSLSGEENLLEHLETEVKNGKLTIKSEKGYNLEPSSWKSGGIMVRVPVEEINSVTMSGSGDIVGKTKLRSDTMEVVMSGSGDIVLELDSDSVETSLSGSGDIRLSGNANTFNVRISGSGDVHAYELEAKEVDAVVSGSADIKVTATEILTARVSGSGDVHYRGNPGKVDSKTAGSGDVTKG
jgi:hypothetical protein